jgi:hypothetical protein
VVALDDLHERSLVVIGTPPDCAWIAAFLHGSRHLGPAPDDATAPADLAWGRLASAGVTVAIGRSGRPFHTRERQQLSLLCRLADALQGGAAG